MFGKKKTKCVETNHCMIQNNLAMRSEKSVSYHIPPYEDDSKSESIIK